MNGLINLKKPVGITSAKALYKVRSITRQRKSGHAGTLDPGASGVLVLCLGKATKLVELIMEQPKVYRATGRLDVTSESLDADRPLVAVDVADPPALASVQEALASFEGVTEQVPPLVSAIKIKGVPAYKRAARNENLQLKARPVRIYWTFVHRHEWPLIDFEMCCGRGTYVRSLIRDLSEKLGTGGCLTSLARTRVGPLTETEGWTFESLGAASGPEDYLVDLDRARRLVAPEAMVIPERPTGNTPIRNQH